MRSSLLCFLLVLACILPAGCVSYFPEPESPEDTLLIIKAIRRKLTDEVDFFGKYTLVFYNMEDEQVRRVSFRESSTYFTVQGLPPGEYYLGKIFFTYDDRYKPRKEYEAHYVFPLKDGCITFLKRQFVTEIYADEIKKNTYWMSCGWELLEDAELKETISTFKENEALSQWRSILY